MEIQIVTSNIFVIVFIWIARHMIKKTIMALFCSFKANGKESLLYCQGKN